MAPVLTCPSSASNLMQRGGVAGAEGKKEMDFRGELMYEHPKERSCWTAEGIAVNIL
jgi:hypothetical protein